jgi:hypothetical protein
MKDLNLLDLLENHKNSIKPAIQEARSPDGRFNLVEREFPWGKRNIYIPIETLYNEQLQGSRGIPIETDSSKEEMRDQVFLFIDDILESDVVRIKELDHIMENKFEDMSFKSFCEIGFRIPRLQKFYKNRGMRERGFDINKFNVELGTSLGFDCRGYDLNKQDEIDISDCDLIVCYHVLEHVSDPFKAIKLIFNSASSGSLFHIEIPVEEDGPRIKYGHLYPFFRGDMGEMLVQAGFKLISANNVTHTDGPWIERYSALKE